jgi:aspartate-semialdehyde dehydrogenase
LANPQAIKIALIGADTLLGREIEEVLKSRVPGAQVSGFAANAEGTFGEQEGEAVYLQGLDAEAVENASVIVLAGTVEGAGKAYDLVRKSSRKPTLLDCIGALGNSAEARTIAPLLGDTPAVNGQEWLLVLAHPAAAAIALVLKRLAAKSEVSEAVVHIFEPASERGKRGVSELHQQTTSLLAFKPLEKRVFDTQLAFNLLSRYGEEAPDKLIEVENKIERDLATLLGRNTGPAIAMPSLRLIQAPVFHGYSISVWIEFATGRTAQTIEEELASAQIEVRSADQEAPESVGAASQSGLIAGDIRIDRNNARACWIWVVADNLRLTADAVVDAIAALRDSK